MKPTLKIFFLAISCFSIARADHTENGRAILIGKDLSRPLTIGQVTIVGDRNAFHVLNGTSGKEIDWSPSAESKNKCRQIPGFEEQGKCDNYVTILNLTGEGVATVLGTNAASPILRTYQINETGVTMLKEKLVKKATSFFPQQKSLFLEVNETVSFTAGFARYGDAAQVCRNGKVCTPSDASLFKAPEFSEMISKGEYVYAIYMDYITERCQPNKNIKHPHVMRLCTNDTSRGSFPFWPLDLTTFIIARMECSLLDLSYTRLVAVSESYKTTCKGGKPCTAFVGVFLTELPTEKRYSAAVCLFDLEDIDQILDRASFANLTGLPVDSEKIPEPRPGNCQVPNSPVSISFAEHHHQVLQSVEGLPVLSIEGYKITTLTIDHVTADNGTSDQILYFGTDDGSLLRYTFNKSAAKTFRKVPILLDKQEIRHTDWRNKEMKPPNRRLIVSTKTQVVQYQCCAEDAESCVSCAGRQDPPCSWNDERKTCSFVFDSQEGNWRQALQDCVPSLDELFQAVQDLVPSLELFQAIQDFVTKCREFAQEVISDVGISKTPATDDSGSSPTSATITTPTTTTPDVTPPREGKWIGWMTFFIGLFLGSSATVVYFHRKWLWDKFRGPRPRAETVQTEHLLGNPGGPPYGQERPSQHPPNPRP